MDNVSDPSPTHYLDQLGQASGWTYKTWSRYEPKVYAVKVGCIYQYPIRNRVTDRYRPKGMYLLYVI